MPTAMTRNTSSSISRLPEEVLAMIFEDILGQFETARNQDLPRPVPDEVVSQWRDMPQSWMSKWRLETLIYGLNTVEDASWNAQGAFLMSVASVSRSWREACLRTHRLWSYIVLDDSDGCIDGPNRYYPPNLCLSRSGVVPLYLYACGHSCMEEALGQLQSGGALHRLNSLKLEVVHKEGLMQYLQGISSCPNLQNLTVQATHKVPYKVPLIDLLQNFTNLRSLNLQAFSFDRPGIAHALSLDHLQNLEIAFFDRSDVTSLFGGFRAPLLERLLLVQYHDSHGASSFENFTCDIFRTVKEFIVGGAMTTADILHFLTYTVNVEVLRLFEPNHIYTFGELLPLLECGALPVDLLPKLRALSYTRLTRIDPWASKVDVPMPSFLFLYPLHNLIDSRGWSYASPIREVGLSADTLLHAEPSPLRSLALKVDLTEWRPPYWHSCVFE